MPELAAADRVDALVLVDNVADNLSSMPAYVENELPRLWKRGLRRLSGRCPNCGAHGLAFRLSKIRRPEPTVPLDLTTVGPRETRGATISGS